MAFCKLPPGQIAAMIFIETIQAAPAGNNVTDRLKTVCRTGLSWR
jgi:hypothetical protein